MKKQKSERMRERIKDCFIKFLQDKPIDKIKVTDITQSLNIHRTTFYLYYDSIYDLAQEIEDDVLNPFRALNGYERRLIRLKHLKENRNALKVLLKTHNEPYYHVRLERQLNSLYKRETKNYSDIQVFYAQLFYIFLHRGTIAMIEKWLDQPEKLSEEAFAKILMRLEEIVLNELKKTLNQVMED